MSSREDEGDPIENGVLNVINGQGHNPICHCEENPPPKYTTLKARTSVKGMYYFQANDSSNQLSIQNQIRSSTA